MAGPSDSKVQNILPVQALFNIDNSFNTFIGQGQPFVVSATESIGITDVTTLDATLYPTLSPVSTGQVTSLDVTSTKLTFNPYSGTLGATVFQGALSGTASAATNLANGVAGNVVYQSALGTTAYVTNGSTGQVLTSNGSSAPTWSNPTSSIAINDDTSTNATRYPLFTSVTTGNISSEYTSSTKFQFNPSTGLLSATGFSGSGANLTSIPNGALVNSSVTIGSTSVSLGATVTTFAGLTSVTSTTFVGALTGNASTATSATTATNATNTAITDDTSTATAVYPTWVTNTTGNLPQKTASTKFSFVPSTGVLSVTGLSLTNALGISSGGTNGTATPTAGGVAYGSGTAYAFTSAGTSGQVLTSAGSGTPTWTTPTTGTVTSVGGTGTVNGITLTGTVTSSGNLTLGGTLGSIANSQLTNSAITFGSTSQALGSTVSGISGVTIDNGAVGATTPAAVTATTLIGGGSSANYGQLTGGATGKAVQFQTLGSDSNVSLAVQSKGTGAIDLAAGSSGVNISNGGTVTAITRTAASSGYTTNPTPTISAPTTAGGTQATATCTIGVVTATVSAGGSGYAVGEILTVVGGTSTAAAVLTVATISGSAVATVTITTIGTYTASPTNPAATTSNLSGTGATFTLSFGVNSAFTITGAGSGYVEQPTVTFSSGSATAYATVGSDTTIKSLGTNLNLSTPSGTALQVADVQTGTVVNNWVFRGAAGTGTQSLIGSTAGTATNLNLLWLTKGGSGLHQFATSSSSSNIQFQVSNTASAVNYVQVTGATTASKVVAISAQGSDADVTLSLSPKGAGTIRFGTYTAGVLTPAGYITITDSGGTSRRLLVG